MGYSSSGAVRIVGPKDQMLAQLVALKLADQDQKGLEDALKECKLVQSTDEEALMLDWEINGKWYDSHTDVQAFGRIWDHFADVGTSLARGSASARTTLTSNDGTSATIRGSSSTTCGRTKPAASKATTCSRVWIKIELRSNTGNPMQPLDQAELRRLFDYDPLTGVVTRRVCTANRHRIGEAVGTSGSRGYRQATVYSKKYPLHQLIWMWAYGEWPAHDVDHINRDRADNRLSNLRAIPRSANNHNAGISRRNWSGFTGVAWDKSRCLWMASIRAQGKQIALGRYPSPEAAAAAYAKAKRIYHPTAPAAAGA